MKMTYDESIQYIHSISWKGSIPGLDRTRKLLTAMGRPDRKLRFVHVAGTNGKGSTCAMLASILKEAGYITGLFTSPFIHRFNERMKVNGCDIPDDELAEITEWVKPFAESMEDHPTEFELINCIAMEWFCRRGCDIVVLEVGMGGRFDSTNVIDRPLAAAITSIGLDHTQILGDTVEKIAFEKAGIVKPNGSVVMGRMERAARDVIADVCLKRSAKLIETQGASLEGLQQEGQRFSYKDRHGLVTPLLGEHQLGNVAVVLELVDLLSEAGYEISEQAIAQGLKQTRWPGRFEVLSRNPVFVVDGGHNPQCAQTVADTLSSLYPGRRVVFVVGLMADKDWEGVIDPVAPLAKEFITVSPDIPRALDAGELARRISERYGTAARPAPSVREGISAAVSKLEGDDIACAFGSLYMVSDVRNYFGFKG